jgi:hypothetical protein
MFESYQVQNVFFFFTTFIMTPDSSQSPIQWVLRKFLRGVKLPELEVFRSLPSPAYVKSEYTSTSTSPACLYIMDKEIIYFLSNFLSVIPISTPEP